MADNNSDVGGANSGGPGGSSDVLGQLSPSQREALDQYRQMTNQAVEEALPLLRRSQWNLQIAVAKFFDGEGPDLFAEALASGHLAGTSVRHENLQESLMASQSGYLSRAEGRNRTDPAPRVVPQSPLARQAPWLLGFLLAPLSWGWRAAKALLGSLCFALSFLPVAIRPRALGGVWRSSGGRRMLMPRDTAARFKRDFDEEYGANELPFFEGGLAQAHDLAKKEVKFLLVLLISPEHDDTSRFVRETLLDPEVVAYISNPANEMILWAGNVLDSEAYQAATEYNCTKYPFAALVCLTPKEGSSRMGIVKRLTGTMSAASFLSELQGAMEKYGSELGAARAERAAREVARNIRTEQDSAYERSLAIDRARAREKRAAAAAAAEKEKRARDKAEEAERREDGRRKWRCWRMARLKAEPPAGKADIVRIALKMPEGSGMGRIVRRFSPEATMEELYAFVDCYDMIREAEGGAGGGGGGGLPDDYEHEFGFTIASTLPRVVYEASTADRIGDVIGRSGNLIVEPVGRDDEGDEDEAD